MFDTFVIVDWSAAGTPKTGRDSIWICAVDRKGAERQVENPRTRHGAKNLLGELLSEATSRGERILLGFDFPFGYPAGFAQRLGLTATPPWRAVWDEIAARLTDQENNRNDRFAVAAEFNRRVSNAAFPFWGCPVRFTHEFLGPRHHNGHQAGGLAEKRLIDTWMVGAQPCWKLAYTGSVGSQSLTGIPVVHELRHHRTWADRARIWPFETGLGRPDLGEDDLRSAAITVRRTTGLKYARSPQFSPRGTAPANWRSGSPATPISATNSGMWSKPKKPGPWE